MGKIKNSYGVEICGTTDNQGYKIAHILLAKKSVNLSASTV